NVVYVGGIGAFQVTLGSPATGSSGSYSINEISTSFISLVNFGASAYGGKLETGSAVTHDTVEVRFGPGIKQKAHRFLVPDGATSGVPDANYSYQDYVDVPFQVWNRATNQQLMVSFRDQSRNGTFDLIALNTDATTGATQQSREYIFINNVPYNAVANSSIAQGGGQVFQKMYFFWPTLASGATWDPATLPTSKLQIKYSSVNNYTSTVMSVADVYSDYDGVNNGNFVHPDQHNIYPIKQNDAAKTFQLLMANDGGVFLSGISTSPGTTQGDWKKVGNGYNTSQFYGADKRPGAQEYFGGMQDNATYYTPAGTISSSTTNFRTDSRLSGDGFAVLWHSLDKNKMIGGSQFNYFARSTDGGSTWSNAFSGLTLSGSSPDHSKFPFISKLANSKQAPDNIYTVGSEGVWRSTNFGNTWTLTPITSGWGLTSFTDVEVSKANPNIVWAGSGQYSGKTLFVSTNAGQTFNAVLNPVGFTLGNITRIATHPWETNTAYALYSFAKTAKIMKTTDLGQTWTDISGFGTGTSSVSGFPDVAVYSLYVRPDNVNIIWAGTEIGIVESLDGGASWALLNAFPSVAVWDMKGQDNEIVIATHGRGIWTATVSKDQNGTSKILASATTPQSKFKMVINVPYQYDSILLKFNSTKTVKFIPPDTGTFVLQIGNVPIGSVSTQTISYKGGTAATSPLLNGVNLKLSAYQQKYYDYLISADNFYQDGFSLQSFGQSNSSLQSQHNYSPNKSATATLLVPIIVSSGVSSFVYDDVTLVQPGASGSVFGQNSFNDYVIAEATKDGLTWKPIANGYNSTSNSNWLSAFNTKPGDQSLTVTENFDLKNNFKTGDTLLIRFRLYSNADNTVGWGWSIDNLYIQQTPAAVEPNSTSELMVYPNPSAGKFTINYFLTMESEVSIKVWDVTGRNISFQNLGTQPVGKNQAELNLEAIPDGIYLARLSTIDGERVVKVFIKK
ncbi:MAG: T9SS type A sorting domain-containing protein, partial [Bacteroidetes bacterium]|nr:T9SS type A sorting domain-containing protein [Bacteroidota bacterium]